MTQKPNSPKDIERSGRPEFAPAVDIYDAAEEIVVVADMPGVSASALDVHLDRGDLSIRGRVTAPTAEGEAVFQEYQVGDFVRDFTLTEDIDPEGISAELTNGVLTLHLPKATDRKPRKIQVKVG